MNEPNDRKRSGPAAVNSVTAALQIFAGARIPGTSGIDTDEDAEVIARGNVVTAISMSAWQQWSEPQAGSNLILLALIDEAKVFRGAPIPLAVNVTDLRRQMHSASLGGRGTH